MSARKSYYYCVASSLALVNAGCICVGFGGWCGSFSGPRKWTETTTERIPVESANLQAVHVKTHNGSIHFDGQPQGSAESYVEVTKKAGGWDTGDAEEALQAIEAYAEREGSHVLRVGWRWNVRKQSNWAAHVSLHVKAPADVRLVGRTHNGALEVQAATGDVRLVTHNGSVDVESSGAVLEAESHNGPINARYAGDDVTLTSHNGAIRAHLERSVAPDADLSTHNGEIEVVLGEQVSAEVNCRTHNGRIKCALPLDRAESSRSQLTGRIGTGKGSLEVTTHNGSIQIRKAIG